MIPGLVGTHSNGKNVTRKFHTSTFLEYLHRHMSCVLVALSASCCPHLSTIAQLSMKDWYNKVSRFDKFASSVIHAELFVIFLYKDLTYNHSSLAWLMYNA